MRTKPSPSAVATNLPSGENDNAAEPPNGGDIVATFFCVAISQTYVSELPALARRLPSAEKLRTQNIHSDVKSLCTFQESTSITLIVPSSYGTVSYETASNRPSPENCTPLGLPVPSLMVRISSPERADQTRTAWSLQIAATRLPAREIAATSTDTPPGKLIVFSCRADCAEMAVGKQQMSDNAVTLRRIRAVPGTGRIAPWRELRSARPSR